PRCRCTDSSNWICATTSGHCLAACTCLEKGGRMSADFDSVVARIERHHGVLGAMLVGLDDGMVIAGDAGSGRDSDTAAALAASLFRRTRTAADDAQLG